MPILPFKNCSTTVVCLLLPLCFAATQAAANENYDLTFEGDGTFLIPHQGNSVHAAIVDIHANEVVAKQSDTISGTGEPAFTFQFSEIFEEGKLYDLHYWIDSNFGEGSVGSCDPIDIDHQWRIAFTNISDNITEVTQLAPEEQAPVCATFE
ncbi:hypothetical protein HZU72_09925 [Halomonas sp. QX-2]|jgi:hypothetical protein|uniref:Uncharacterized protein n=1 Tax=Vreelandella sedimenti TaxID=2729618 RepID=A0A7Z0SPN6_9GAMM|nr:MULTISPECIES: hypothetical protein [Halomonas]NYT72744.1 hypothetical protein [Halomonas sedimenti]|tara:strand:+ start:9102 stop:9557 length:456 start_codon:yes stop_codon:yes gene_type:complete